MRTPRQLSQQPMNDLRPLCCQGVRRSRTGARAESSVAVPTPDVASRRTMSLRLGYGPAMAVALGSLLIFGCTSRSSEADRPRLGILVVLDTLRADRLGSYGRRPSPSPRLDAFAHRSTVFERSYSASNNTLSSHSSIFYGLVPTFALQASDQRGGHPLRSLPEILNGAGIETFVFGHGPVFRVAPVRRSFAESHQGRNVRETMAQLGAFLDGSRLSPRNRFVFVHVYDIHSPYFETPERPDIEPLERGPAISFQQQLRSKGTAVVEAAYEAGVAFVDHHLGRFFDRLDELDASNDLLIIVTADHGEAFGEHRGFFEHTRYLYEEIVRVPLILCRSGRQGGDRVADAVSSMDLAPTFLEFFGLPIPDHLEGRSLLHDEFGTRSIILEGRNDAERAIIRGHHKLITRGEQELELFDLATDPLERRNLAADRPELVSDLKTRMASLFERDARRLGLEPIPPAWRQRELSEQLKALGYL
jgi:arylsulfatase A-like enzyme